MLGTDASAPLLRFGGRGFVTVRRSFHFSELPMYVNVAVLKETLPHERRVPLVPPAVPKLIKPGTRSPAQSGAGGAMPRAEADQRDAVVIEGRRQRVGDAAVVPATQPPALHWSTRARKAPSWHSRHSARSRQISICSRCLPSTTPSSACTRATWRHAWSSILIRREAARQPPACLPELNNERSAS